MQPKYTQPPYRHEPSLAGDERARRAACRVLLLGRSTAVPHDLLPRFRAIANSIADALEAMPDKGASIRREARAVGTRK